MRRAWIALLLVGIPGVLHAQEHWKAATVCVAGRPVVQIDPKTRAEAIPELMVHELVHVHQLQADPRQTCEQRLAWLQRDLDARIAFEAEAYCIQAYWVDAHGGPDARASLEKAMQTLWFNISTQRTYQAVVRIFEHHCPSQYPS
jgi:antitoxin (DNA-binding transcriptional repressor) of toxin-antitoxin stability system